MLEIETLLDGASPSCPAASGSASRSARALMSGPSLLLLDEPLAAVDVPLRRRILPYLRRVRDELRVPIVYVSHDREEIDELADQVVLIENGRVVATGPPAGSLVRCCPLGSDLDFPIRIGNP